MFTLRAFAPGNVVRVAQRGMAYRKHPRTGAMREVVQKYRAINTELEAAATASGLPWRNVAST